MNTEKAAALEEHKRNGALSDLVLLGITHGLCHFQSLLARAQTRQTLCQHNDTDVQGSSA